MRVSVPITALLLVASGGVPAPAAPPAVQAAANSSEAAQDDALVAWDDLVLPRGFHLDLATGRVSDRASGEDVLRYAGGVLTGGGGAVGRLPEDAVSGGRVPRGEAASGTRWAPTRGSMLGVDLGVRGWGFLRVLDADPGAVRLERWFRTGGAPGAARWRDERLPVEPAEGGGLALAPLHTAEGGPWRVEARAVGGARKWQALGEWSGVEPFVDPSADGGAVREYRLVPLEVDGSYGLRARGIADRRSRGLTPDLGREDRVNLLTGEVDGGRTDLVIDGVSTSGVNLSPEPGVLVASLGSNELATWTLPALDSARYAGQRRYLPVGRDLAVVLPEGLFVHLSAVPTEDGSGTRLQTRVDPWGERLFLPEPDAPDWTWSAERGVALDAPPPAPAGVADRITGRLLEREVGFDSGRWERLGVAEPGEPQIDADPGPPGVVRYRCRWITPEGRLGPAGEPFGALVGDDGGAGTALLLDRLVERLGHASYEERRRARAGLAALGDRARARLERAVASPDAEVAAAAKELLGRLAESERRTVRREESGKGEAGAGVRFPVGEGDDDGDDGFASAGSDSRLLHSLASERGLDAPPAGWLDDDAGVRALALLVAAESPEAGIEGWRALLAEVDPDRGVRLVASLWPELARPGAWTPSFGPGSEDEAAGLLEDALRGLETGGPWTVLARLQFLHDLDRARTSGTSEAAARERALLGLRLLQRHAESGESVFLDAALHVVADPLVRMRAARNLFDLRARDASAAERTEIVLGSASGILLRDTLESLRDEDATNVDLILPTGDYALPPGDLRAARVEGNGLRVIGRGEVRIGFGLMVQRDAVVTLRGLVLDPVGGACLRAQQAQVLLEDCRLLSSGQGVQVTSGLLEMRDCVLLDRGGRGGKGGNGIRLSGRSACRLSRTLVDAGGEALYGATLALVESSVLDGGPRNAISAMVEGELIALDSLIRGDGSALHSVGRGLLEGCVLVGGASVATQLGERVHACPTHLVHAGGGGVRNDWRKLDRCPLGR